MILWQNIINFYSFCHRIFSLSLSLGVSDDSGEDERTGIAEGGWRKEKASSKTQLNEDMEKESGEPITVSTVPISSAELHVYLYGYITINHEYFT